MPVPKSDLTLFVEALNATKALKGNAKVTLGAKRLAEGGAPARIVIYPREGRYENPIKSNVSSIRDQTLTLAAHLWAPDIDSMRYLEQLFFQALAETDVSNGSYWTATGNVWSDSSDTSVQGEEMEIRFTLYLAANAVPLGVGSVLSTTLTQV